MCSIQDKVVLAASHLSGQNNTFNVMFRHKDQATTQSTHGFRVSALQTAHHGQLCRVDKKDAKAAGADGISQLLCRYCCSECDVQTYCKRRRHIGSQIVECVDALHHWASGSGCTSPDAQQSGYWRLLSVSLLIVSESLSSKSGSGASCHDDQPPVRCALIDFAHCFFGEQGIDHNFADGLIAVKHAVESLLTT